MDSAGKKALYRSTILARIPRTLGLLDREATSPTAGCCDRTYWAWKFVDFPGARFQESLCVLSFVWSRELEGNVYYHSEKLLHWIELAIEYWAKIQRRDGSFDEAYPLERSLAATAFTSFYVSEALSFLGDDLPTPTRDTAVRCLERAGDWLRVNDETHGFLSNHLAAAAAALEHIHRLSGAERFHRRGRYFIDKILDHQSSEGWYDEYGGPDPGYQTHGSFYLSRYCELTGAEDVAQSLDRSCRFLSQFVHPDGSIGGEYASRNTKTYYPAAYEMLAAKSPSAAWIAETLRPSVENLSAAGLGSVDIYNFFPLLNNYVFAYCAVDKLDHQPVEQAPEDGDSITHFPDAGLLKVRTQCYDAYIALKKGGVVQAFDRRHRRLVLSDCGYIGRLKDGRQFSSQWPDPEARADLQLDSPEKTVRIEGGFFRVSRPVMDPIRFLGFRLFSLTVGRLAGAARWLKNILVKTLIYRSQRMTMRYERTIRLSPSSIEIADRIAGVSAESIEDLFAGDFFTTIHMGSARYFVPNELTPTRAPDGGSWERVNTESAGDAIERRSLTEFR